MIIKILKYVLFSVITCYFEYAKKELYFINEGNIYLERNIINFKNSRILADADNQFDLNNFYESTKYKGSNTTPNLNNVDGKTKKLIHKIQKELNEAKKELNNERNGELSIQPIQDKRVIKKSEHIFKIDEDKINDKYNKITLSNCYKKLKKISKSKKSKKNIIIKVMLLIATLFVVIALGMMNQMILLGLFWPFILIIGASLNRCS
ncbi:fam-b protein [Plasmodium vinckei vinckei]|uniref:Fam-b protein n=1 Tax=Plasmodium vinckei vinckei TaxID=54757 RepID=A0A449BPH9_PLAVN|nr:fam-b protein [Plasmodium vinckei vinckei]VEV55376.1 fam-b protein [Plasmodium vinckei vinckei]